jgi:hypothetical protein
MTKDEKIHYCVLADLGCVVCANLGHGYSPAEIHHIRHGAGAGQKTHWSKAIPLCPAHHRNGGYGIALHAGQKEFERLYGSEEFLLELTQRRISNANSL